MVSNRYIKTFAIRYVSYFVILASTWMMLLQFGPIALAEMSYRRDQVFGKKYTVSSQVVTSGGIIDEPEASESVDTAEGFGNLLSNNETRITPVSTEYGLVIEKINANAKVIANVDPGIESEYTKALQQGIAEAKDSTKPGEPGNLFLFSHSTDAPWNISRYNAIFYLLRELEPGDRAIVYYQGRRYDYIVFDKTITKPDDISFLSNRYNKPVLTLQTCDPPGTTFNRLLVRAKLAGT